MQVMISNNNAISNNKRSKNLSIYNDSKKNCMEEVDVAHVVCMHFPKVIVCHDAALYYAL